MKFMILVKSNPHLEKRIDAMSDADMQASMAEMELFNDALRRAGVMKDCDGLRPSHEGMRVRFDGDARSVPRARSRAIWWPAIGCGTWPASTRRLRG